MYLHLNINMSPCICVGAWVWIYTKSLSVHAGVSSWSMTVGLFALKSLVVKLCEERSSKNRCGRTVLPSSLSLQLGMSGLIIAFQNQTKWLPLVSASICTLLFSYSYKPCNTLAMPCKQKWYSVICVVHSKVWIKNVFTAWLFSGFFFFFCRFMSG